MRAVAAAIADAGGELTQAGAFQGRLAAVPGGDAERAARTARTPMAPRLSSNAAHHPGHLLTKCRN